jgi:hypothetical protein
MLKLAVSAWLAPTPSHSRLTAAAWCCGGILCSVRPGLLLIKDTKVDEKNCSWDFVVSPN